MPCILSGTFLQWHSFLFTLLGLVPTTSIQDGWVGDDSSRFDNALRGGKKRSYRRHRVPPSCFLKTLPRAASRRNTASWTLFGGSVFRRSPAISFSVCVRVPLSRICWGSKLKGNEGTASQTARSDPDLPTSEWRSRSRRMPVALKTRREAAKRFRVEERQKPRHPSWQRP